MAGLWWFGDDNFLSLSLCGRIVTRLMIKRINETQIAMLKFPPTSSAAHNANNLPIGTTYKGPNILANWMIACLMILLCATTEKTLGQSVWSCQMQDDGGIPDPDRGLSSCGTHFDYVPDAYTYHHQVKMNFHFMLNGSGGGNFNATHDNNGTSFSGHNYVDILVDQANQHLSYNHQMFLPPGNSTPLLPLKYEIIKKGVYFHDDSNFYDMHQVDASSETAALMTAHGVNRDSEINVFFVSDPVHGPMNVGNWGFANPGGPHRHLVIQGAWQNYVHWASGFNNAYQQARLLIHEMGHNLGLYHTMMTGGGACSYTADDLCADTPNQFEMQVWGMAAPYGCCPVNQHGPVTCSNNMMDYAPAWALTPEQLGRIHRTLTTNMLDFTEPTYCLKNGVAKVIPTGTNVTWNGSKVLSTDLIVENGATLTIKCDVHLPANAAIIVKPNARLIIDGGRVTNACDQQWKGIEVWGTTNQHQFPATHPTYQGMVILKNGAVIEHAREAVQLWKPNDWNSTGGVVQVQGTSPTLLGGTFLNCRRAVTFMTYQNFHPSVPAIKRTNNSYFHYASFVVDDEYRSGNDFYTHVSMLAVDGVLYRACTFKNAQTQITQSSKLGYGIFSIDANYTVTGHCTQALPTGTPCPTQSLNRGKFIGLGQGIHALDGGTGRGFTADLLRFENNVVGVYTGELSVFAVTRNEFVLGDRNVIMDRPEELTFQEFYHRAISTQQSHGFRIEENTITAAQNVSAQGIVGIVIENSKANNTQVYKNSASNLNIGYVGEGHCVDHTQASSVGHQFLCNTNSNNFRNIWARQEAGGGGTHTIRTQQGSNSSPAMNMFDRELSVLDASDLKNSTQWVINYWHKGGASQPLDNTIGWVGTTMASGTNNCPSLFGGGPMQMSQDLASQTVNELMAAKQAWLNTSYVYASLIDGGNTPATVQQVQESWPHDAWELRAQLVDKSPYLSTGVLVEMMKKNILPQAIVLEICLINPEATKKESFIQWAENEAPNPLPAYMIDLISGSWAEKTFRMELEAQMGKHHADMTLASDLMQASFNVDTTGIPVDSMLSVWQKLPSYGARWGELRQYIRARDFNAARTLLNGLDASHRMDHERGMERDRALWFTDWQEALHSEGRTVMQLDSAEVLQLQAFALAGADLPAGWARNILCFGYAICLSPPGGVGGDNKTLTPIIREQSESDSLPLLLLMPNPASVAVSIAIEVPGGLSKGHIRISDISGREIVMLPVNSSPQQLVWDTRGQQSGVYQVELFGNGKRLATERLIIQPR